MGNVRWWFVFFFLLTAVGAHGVDPPGLGLGDNLVRLTSLPYPPAPSRPVASVTLLYCLLSMWWSCYRLYISVLKKSLIVTLCQKRHVFISNSTKNRVDRIIRVLTFVPRYTAACRGCQLSYQASRLRLAYDSLLM